MSDTAPAVTVRINDVAFDQVVAVRIERDLQNIAGTFQVTLVDEARIRDALIAQIGQPTRNGPINPGDAIRIDIDGEPVLIGWIEVPSFDWSGNQIRATVRGRDKTGDLVECAALPDGPDEFRNVDLLQVAQAVCAKFGIGVKQEVDIGAPYVRLSKHRHMTALAFLESAARQRSVLLVSDGIGNLLLTRAGSTRAPAALAIGDNVQHIDVSYDWTQRFSDYYVLQSYGAPRGGSPAMTPATAPSDGSGDPPASPGSRTAAEAPAIGTMGHAIDPDVKRWRPTVRYTRSQSGMSSVQEQAEWMARVAKGQSDKVVLTVLGYRAGDDNALWRPNAVASVWDPYSGIDRDMLIAGVAYLFDQQGMRTELRVAGLSAYDRINEAERSRRRGHGRGRKSTQATTGGYDERDYQGYAP